VPVTLGDTAANSSPVSTEADQFTPKQAPTDGLSYNPNDTVYWDESGLKKKLDRIFRYLHRLPPVLQSLWLVQDPLQHGRRSRPGRGPDEARRGHDGIAHFPVLGGERALVPNDTVSPPRNRRDEGDGSQPRAAPGNQVYDPSVNAGARHTRRCPNRSLEMAFVDGRMGAQDGGSGSPEVSSVPRGCIGWCTGAPRRNRASFGSA